MRKILFRNNLAYEFSREKILETIKLNFYQTIMLSIMLGGPILLGLTLLLIYLINPEILIILFDMPPEWLLQTSYLLLAISHLSVLIYNLIKIRVKSDPNILYKIFFHLFAVIMGIIYAFWMGSNTFPNIHPGWHHMSYGLYFSLFVFIRGGHTIGILLGLLPINDEINNYNELYLWGDRDSSYGYDNWIASYYYIFIIVCLVAFLLELTLNKIRKSWNNDQYQMLEY